MIFYVTEFVFGRAFLETPSFQTHVLACIFEFSQSHSYDLVLYADLESIVAELNFPES